MVTTVTVSQTVIPLPNDPRDTENPIFDEKGVPLIGGPFQAILDAVNSLHRKIDRMSGNLNQVEADIAAIAAANAKMTADLDAIKAIIAGMQAGTVLTQADVDALHSAAGVTEANTASADAMVPPPVKSEP